MAFDADAYVAALEPPAFTAGGKVYRGRLMSIEQWLALHVERERLQKKGATLQETQAWTIKVVRAFFPRRWYQLYNPAVVAFTRLPYKAQLAALADFSASQRSAMPSPVAPEPPGTEE